MKQVAAVMIIIICCGLSSTALAFNIEEAFIAPLFEKYSWEETEGDIQLVKEDGFRYGVMGGGTADVYGKALLVHAKLSVWGGSVDYDGNAINQTSPSVLIPIKTTTTNYFGVTGEAAAGWRFHLREVAVEPFVGLGYQWWLRRILNTTSSDGSAFFPGYSEIWENYYTKLGVKGNFQINKDLAIFAEGGGKYPFYTSNEGDFLGLGWVKLKPKAEWAAFAELGARYKWFRPSIYYEGYRYSASDAVPAIDGTPVFQPDTDADVVGFTFGFLFK